MDRRRPLRLAAVTFALAVVATSAGGVSARNGTVSTGTTAATSSAIATRHGALHKGPRAPGRMDKATNRPSSGTRIPRLASPLAAASVKQRGPSPLAVAPAPVQATLTANPAIGQPGFDGMSRSSGPDTNGEPPDPFLAVGPDHIMQILNSSLQMTDRAGTFLDGASLSGFVDSFEFPGIDDPEWFDPHVIYDSLHGRWLMTMAGLQCGATASADFGTGYLFFAISDTSDPTDFWTGTYFFDPDFLIDYPAPGTSSDKFAFSANYFDMAAAGSCPGAEFAGTDVLAIDWADWLGSDSDFEVKEVLGTGTDQFTPRVAVQAPATSPTLHIIIESTPNGTDLNVKYYSVTGSVHAKTTVTSGGVDLTAAGVIAPFLTPPAPNQPGPNTIANAVDERPTDAVWQNNRLSFVSTYPCTPTGDSTERDCVRISQLNTATTTPTLRQDFLIAENGKDSYMGGVGMAGNGTLHAVWTRSSATAGDFPSSYAAYQLTSDALDSVSPKELLKAGTGVYTGERWGDYVGVAQDPLVPSAVWQANEYSGTGAEWKTWVSRLQTLGTTYVPITPVRVLDSRGGAGPTGKFSANVAKTWQVTGVGPIPSTAVAVTGNVTVTNQEGAGYVTVTPTPNNAPIASTINFPVGDVRANNLSVALSSSGTLSAVYKAAAGKKTHLVFDVTGYFLADDTGTTFTPLTPIRALDTRSSIGLAGPFATGTPRTLAVAGFSGVPLTATAITGNLTVVGQTWGGYLSVTRTPTASPATSTLNFPVGDTRANGVFAPLDGTGSLSIVYKGGSGSTTHVVLDITGYFEPGTAGLRFVPMNPARVMDTRGTSIPFGLSGVFHSKVSRILPIAGHWGLPTAAAAVSGNLTVVGQTGAGYVTVSPAAPPPTPPTSTLNFPVGDVRANGLVNPLNGSGETYLVYISGTGKTTHLVMDLSGYFE